MHSNIVAYVLVATSVFNCINYIARCFVKVLTSYCYLHCEITFQEYQCLILKFTPKSALIFTTISITLSLAFIKQINHNDANYCIFFLLNLFRSHFKKATFIKSRLTKKHATLRASEIP